MKTFKEILTEGNNELFSLKFSGEDVDRLKTFLSGASNQIGFVWKLKNNIVSIEKLTSDFINNEKKLKVALKKYIKKNDWKLDFN